MYIYPKQIVHTVQRERNTHQNTFSRIVRRHSAGLYRLCVIITTRMCRWMCAYVCVYVYAWIKLRGGKVYEHDQQHNRIKRKRFSLHRFGIVAVSRWNPLQSTTQTHSHTQRGKVRNTSDWKAECSLGKMLNNKTDSRLCFITIADSKHSTQC